MSTIDSFTLDTFAPLVGSSFTVSSGEQGDAGRAGDGQPQATLELELIEANGVAGARSEEANATRTPFSLLFLCRSAGPLADATYRVAHPQLGDFELFIVPVAQDGDGVRYEAIFN